MQLSPALGILLGLGLLSTATEAKFIRNGNFKMTSNNNDDNNSNHATSINRRLKRPTDSSTCDHPTVVEVQYADHAIEESYISCEQPDGTSYRLNVPDHVADKAKGVIFAASANANPGAGVAAGVGLELPAGSEIDEATATITVPPGKALGFKNRPAAAAAGPGINGSGFGSSNGDRPNRDRRLAVTGTKSVLVVRVIASDAATTATVQRLSDSVFGNNADGDGADAANLASQYSACSHGKLTFVEAPPRTGNAISIVNGATTVTLPNTATTDGDGVMNNAITAELNAQFNVAAPTPHLADHVMHCLPPGTMAGIAYASLPGTRSVYSDAWCTYLSAQMHEVGHNLGFHHSGEGGAEYADQSGMLGYSYSQDDGPLMCFNGAKSWQSGWYADRHFSFKIAEMSSWSGNLVGQVDYENQNSNDPILVQLDTADNAEYYVQFNRKAGANSGTVEGGNEVMITKEENSNARPRSLLLAKIGEADIGTATGTYQIPNYDGSGLPLKLEVTAIDLTASPPFASIAITTGKPCSSNAECDDGLFCNGVEYCGSDGLCRDAANPCPSTQSCGETSGGYFCGECQSVTLELTTDSYPTETSWTVTDPSSAIIDSKPQSSYTAANTAHVQLIGGDLSCLSGGVHTFTINDSYGDGICCSFGSGSYKLKDQNGVVLHEGGEFTNTESKDFVIAVPSPPMATPTASPVTASPVSQAPVTAAPVTASPVSSSPTASPVTASPVSQAPVSQAPVSSSPTASPITQSPVTGSPTASPITQAPVTSSPTASPVTQAPISSSPTTSPVTQAPTASPVSQAPVTSPPTSSCGNGICELSDGGCSAEFVSFCPSDCISGGSPGGSPVCGNNICEAGNGENYDTCPSDCPHSGGKPSSRYYCGTDGCDNPVCNAAPLSCTTESSQDTRYCCGDGTCSPGEDATNCPLDCEGATAAPVPPPTAAPISPPTAAPVFQPTAECGAGGSSCGSNAECCSQNCKGNGVCK